MSEYKDASEVILYIKIYAEDYMELFSQRRGIKPVKSIMQFDSMDDDLRNRIWDIINLHYLESMPEMIYSINSLDEKYRVVILIKTVWHNYLKKPVDTIGDYWPGTYRKLREYYFDFKWFEVYDFIEFIANNYQKQEVNESFMEACNFVLKEELSAYRFVGGKIAQITKEEEIAEIEEALDIPDSLKPIKIHLKTSIDLLSDRKSPDYRNSIKESISAVEAICKLIANNNNATLGLAIETIEKGKKVKMHSALGRGFSNLYGYTNAADGIRHALMDEHDLDFEDAKFMLVSCSAFINYLIVKASKTGIKL